jgi:hypothetical protein
MTSMFRAMMSLCGGAALDRVVAGVENRMESSM